MQALFIFYVCDKFMLDRWNFGSVLYLTANLATVFVGVVYYEKYPRMHNFFTRYYFFAMPLALLLIGFMLGDAHRAIFVVTVTLVIAYSLGQAGLFKKYRIGNALMEGWGFVILTLWTLMTTFVQL